MIVHNIQHFVDRDKSAESYKQGLQSKPQLHVLGMTELKLTEFRLFMGKGRN